MMLYVRLKQLESGGSHSSEQAMQDVDVGDEINRQRSGLDSLRQQTNSERQALDVLRTEYDSAQREMQLLVEAIDKRHQLLESLHSRLDAEITTRRRDIEVQFLATYFGGTSIRELTRGLVTLHLQVDPGAFSGQRQEWKTQRGPSGSALLLRM